MADSDFGVSDPLLDFVKRYEGFAPRAQWDYKQWSSGYGTRANPGESIDRDTAELRLRSELNNAAQFVDSKVPNLPSGIRNAMISLTFNAGGDWANAGLGDMLRAGDYEGAKQRFLQYTKAGGKSLPGLEDRRAAEATMFGGDIPAMSFGEGTGGKKMGVLDILSGGRSSDDSGEVGGLLGGLGDPSKLAAFAMIAKGLNPWSELNPMEFMKIAEQQRNQALLRDEAKQRLDISRGHLNIARAADLRSQTEANRKEQERQQERELFQNLFGVGGGGGPAPESPDQRPAGLPDVARSLPDTSSVGFAEPATGAPVDQMSSQQLRQIQSRFAPDTTSFKVLQDAYNKALAREQLQQERATGAEIYKNLGANPQAEDFDKALADPRISDKQRAELEKRRTSAQAGPNASTLKTITKDQDDVVELNSLSSNLAEAKQLALSGKVQTGLRGYAQRNVGGRLGELASDEARATTRFANITESLAIDRMSEKMKGATSDREMFQNLRMVSDVTQPMSVRLQYLDQAIKRADELKRLKAGRIQQLGGGKFEVPGSDEAASSGGGGSLPGGWTVRVK